MELIVAIVVAVIFGLIGRYVAKEKNRSDAEGFIGGFFLGPIGIIIVALMPTLEKDPIKEKELTDNEDIT